MKNQEVEVTSWYDRPEWFEIGFHNETKKEADFFEAAFKKYCSFPVKRLLEPACGSGRIVTEMAARGYDVTGFDLSEPSLEFLRARLKKLRLKATVLNADMTKFKLPGKFDSAFCTYNSFRVLTTETAASSHLKCVADAVRSGGLYFLGMHLAPPGCDPTCIERWTGQRDNTHVTTTLRIVDYDLKARTERLRISLLVREFERNGKASNGASRNGKMLLSKRPAKVYRLRDEFDYRTYTAAQIKKLIASIGKWDMIDVFDFWYELDEPQELDDDQVDTLFVLQRR
jgi:SAM-dependent methyltransferase